MAHRCLALLVAIALPVAALAQPYSFPVFPPPGMSYTPSGGMQIGSPTGGAPGAGGLNVAGALKVNGTTVSTSATTVTTTGSPASGNLAKFSGALTLTNGDLSGDCTTSGALTITCSKTGGVSFAPIATSGSASDLSAGTVPAARMPALTGDITTSAGAVATTIASGAVTLGKMANLAANSLIGNNTGSSATPIALTQAQATALLNQFTSSLQGVVPSSGGGTSTFLRADGSWATPGSGGSGGGSVTSVGLSMPAEFTVSGSPVTGSGTLTATKATQSANQVWAGPTSGAAAAPAFRALVGADMPNPSSSTLGGVESFASVTHQFLTSISTSGVPSAAQPTCAYLSDSVASCSTDTTNASNISSGTLPAARMPALTGDTTTSAGAVATTTGLLHPTTNVYTSAHTITSSEEIIECNSSSSVTLTLPAATGTLKHYWIKQIGTGNCVLAPNGTDNIDGSNTSITLSTRYAGLEVIDRASANWDRLMQLQAGSDCSGLLSAITCTKTNGTSFATSATTDTTNATNITSGTLAVAEGGTGTGTAPTSGQVLEYNSSSSYAPTLLHKPIGFFINGVQPSASYVFLYTVPPQAVTVPSGAGSSTCVASVAATGSTTITVKKNGSSVGTAVWSASGTTCAWTWSSSTTWNGTSDTLEIDGPATADATLANISIILNPTTTAP